MNDPFVWIFALSLEVQRILFRVATEFNGFENKFFSK